MALVESPAPAFLNPLNPLDLADVVLRPFSIGVRSLRIKCTVMPPIVYGIFPPLAAEPTLKFCQSQGARCTFGRRNLRRKKLSWPPVVPWIWICWEMLEIHWMTNSITPTTMLSSHYGTLLSPKKPHMQRLKIFHRKICCIWPDCLRILILAIFPTVIFQRWVPIKSSHREEH